VDESESETENEINEQAKEIADAFYEYFDAALMGHACPDVLDLLAHSYREAVTRAVVQVAGFTNDDGEPTGCWAIAQFLRDLAIG
jgi:hypothetical protein